MTIHKDAFFATPSVFLVWLWRASFLVAACRCSCRGLPKVIFLALAEAKGKGGKTSALEVEAEGEAEGLVFCFSVFGGHIQT